MVFYIQDFSKTVCVYKLPINIKYKIYNIPIDTIEYKCKSNKINKIENLPVGLKKFDCSYTNISKIENLPDSLEIFNCSNCFDLYKIINLPKTLIEFDCSCTEINKLENLPKRLMKLNCEWTDVETIENLPLGLISLIHSDYKLTNVYYDYFINTIYSRLLKFTLESYQSLRRIQLRIKLNKILVNLDKTTTNNANKLL